MFGHMKNIFLKSVLLQLIIVFASTVTLAYVIKGTEDRVDAADIKIGGRQYVLLTDVCRAYGIECEWDSITRKITLRKNGREAFFLAGSKYYYDGKKTKKLSAPLYMKKGSAWVPVKFARYTVKQLFDLDKRPPRAPRTKAVAKAAPGKAKRPPAKKFEIKKVIIDPGHGGKDPGAIGRTRLYEKHVVLDVSKRIKKKLEKAGMDVIMTRSSDKFISLGGRTKIANQNDADLFVSIHANANKKRWMRGFEVYYLSEATDDNARALAAAENSVLRYEEESFNKHTKNLDAIVWDLTFTENREEAIELAGFICQEVARAVRPKKNSIRSARFYVLKGAEMPSVLVELGYLSNSYNERNLKKGSYRQKIAEGVAEGILSYKDEFERTNGFSR